MSLHCEIRRHVITKISRLSVSVCNSDSGWGCFEVMTICPYFGSLQLWHKHTHTHTQNNVRKILAKIHTACREVSTLAGPKTLVTYLYIFHHMLLLEITCESWTTSPHDWCSTFPIVVRSGYTNPVSVLQQRPLGTIILGKNRSTYHFWFLVAVTLP